MSHVLTGRGHRRWRLCTVDLYLSSLCIWLPRGYIPTLRQICHVYQDI